MRYLPHTEADCRRMLAAIGVGSVEELFAQIPPGVRRERPLSLPPALSEWELLAEMGRMAGENAHPGTHDCFLGAGAYHHFIPTLVDQLASRGEFLTAYTPYQPEISQGTLQAVFEYQTLLCQLTGMEVANASMYEGASALAEAALMALRIARGERVVVSRAVHPEYRRVLRTYLAPAGAEVAEVGFDESGATDPAQAREALGKPAAALIVQNPNFFGRVEDLGSLGALAREGRALFVVGVAEALSLGLLTPPGEAGAEAVVGEGQSFGVPVSYGGPYLGIFATRQKHVRQMPGRLAGETVDGEGRRGFVLTFATREQHIRRERATSNICTNEGLMALRAAIYLAVMGRRGLRDVALQNVQRAAYLRERLTALAGFSERFPGPVFNEFVLGLPAPAAVVNEALAASGMVGGYDLGRDYPELGDAMLVCATELTPRAAMDRLAEALGAFR
ncbi:MAG: aminomethyl-transferring glycine dehydrogenase subunit GcvPA [Nitrospinota bacterium]